MKLGSRFLSRVLHFCAVSRDPPSRIPYVGLALLILLAWPNH